VSFEPFSDSWFSAEKVCSGMCTSCVCPYVTGMWETARLGGPGPGGERVLHTDARVDCPAVLNTILPTMGPGPGWSTFLTLMLVMRTWMSAQSGSHLSPNHGPWAGCGAHSCTFINFILAEGAESAPTIRTEGPTYWPPRGGQGKAASGPPWTGGTRTRIPSLTVPWIRLWGDPPCAAVSLAGRSLGGQARMPSRARPKTAIAEGYWPPKGRMRPRSTLEGESGPMAQPLRSAPGGGRDIPRARARARGYPVSLPPPPCGQPPPLSLFSSLFRFREAFSASFPLLRSREAREAREAPESLF